MKTTYLFYGFGAEYVLHPVYEEMKKQEKNCLEVDALVVRDSRKLINALQKKDVVLVTSAHLLLDRKSFTDFYPTKNIFYGVAEIISLVKPIKTIFFPHDLTEPLIQYEIQYLNQLDLFLSPIEPFTSIYSQYVPTEEVGWIKYTNSPNQKRQKVPRKNRKAIWFLSDFILYINMGIEK